jgi:hypothetical protein
MKPFEPDELSDRELDGLLPEWKAPEPPARLRAAIFAEVARPKWQRWWWASLRVPVPVACVLALAAAFGIWRGARPAPPRVITRTVRVEVPVAKETLVAKTIYRCDPKRAASAQRLRPVSELQPQIIRGVPDEE